jgi:hypothetical protein
LQLNGPNEIQSPAVAKIVPKAHDANTTMHQRKHTNQFKSEEQKLHGIHQLFAQTTRYINID